MPRVRCTECQGYNHDGMTCRWGYIRTMPVPDSSQETVKDSEYDTEW